MSVGDLVEGRVLQVCEDHVLIHLTSLAAPLAPARLLDAFDLRPGDEVVDLLVTDVTSQGEIILRLQDNESDRDGESLDIPTVQGKGKGRGGYASLGAVLGPSYTKHQLLSFRVATTACSGLPKLQPYPEEELESLLHRSILSSELPPPWWSKSSAQLKRSTLQLALRTVNMQAVYAMQPESSQFREALGALDLDAAFLQETLTLLWADVWSETWSDVDAAPPSAEAVEWLLLRGAPAHILLPEDPDSLKMRMKGLRLLGHLGPRVAAASAAAVAGCLRDPDVKGRRAAAAALAKLGHSVGGHAPRAIPRLLRLLNDSDPLCGADAAVALGSLGSEALKAAAELLEESVEAQVQSRACLALGEAGPEAAAFAPQLLSLLGAEGAPGHLRASAIQALGRIGLAAGVETCSLISYCCTQDPEGSVREAACVALGLFAKEAKSGAFQGADELLELARPALASALDDPEPFVREAAAAALHVAA